MVLFRRQNKRDDDDVRWLRSTELRAPKRRRWLVWLALLLGAGLSIFGATIALLPKPQREAARVQPRPDPAPRTSSAPAAPHPPAEQPARSESLAQPAPVQQPEEKNAPAHADAVPPAEPPAAQGQGSEQESQWAGAFPSSGVNAADSDADFAVYLHAGAPDQASAQTMVVEAQRRYAEALGGRRLTYRRVRVGDEYMWRLRLAGLTQAQAREACERLSAMGAGCEVGPR